MENSGQQHYQIRIYAFTAVFGSYFLLELIISHISHSLTLLIDAYHTLYNVMALVSYITAIKMSQEHTLKNTFGWARIEVLSMMVSILALGALCFLTAVEAVQTTLHASHSDAMHHPVVVLALGVAGVVLNFICFLFIGGFSYSQSFLHVSPQEVQVNVTVPQTIIAGTKLLSSSTATSKGEEGGERVRLRKICRDFSWNISCSILVIVCSIIVYKSEGKVALYIDPALSLVAAIFLMSTSYSFVKESGMILLQTVPSNMDVVELKARLMKQFSSIKNVHDLHVWRLTKDKVIATAHVIFESPKAYAQIGGHVSAFLKDEGISHTTIQPEFFEAPGSAVTESKTSSSSSRTRCVLRCEMAECEPRTCCNENLKVVDSITTAAADGENKEQGIAQLDSDQNIAIGDIYKQIIELN